MAAKRNAVTTEAPESSAPGEGTALALDSRLSKRVESVIPKKRWVPKSAKQLKLSPFHTKELNLNQKMQY